jgi:pimeloyl-ACP methyl ester carboxylesterase
MSFLMPKFTKGFVDTPDGAQIPYLMIGAGPVQRVVIPGAGDGLAMVTDASTNLAFFFRKQARRYRILVLSRRHPLPRGHSIERQADDLIHAIDQLGVAGTVLECNSAGGPVGQFIAAKRPDMVAGLVLSVTLHRSNPQTSAVVREWLDLIDKKSWSKLTWSTIEYTFNAKTLERYRVMRPFLGLIAPRPKHPERIVNLLTELLNFNNCAVLPQIICPTLVSGGEDDRVVPAEIQREMAALIPNAEIQLFPGYGHGNDQENPAYLPALDSFVEKVMPG